MKFKKLFALITASTIAFINISTTTYAKEFEEDLAESTEESSDVSANDIEPEDVEPEDVKPEDITAIDIESEDTSTEADENDVETNDTKTTNEADAKPDSAVAHNKKTKASMHKKQHDTTRLKVIELQVKNWHGKEMVDEETGYTYFSDEIGEYIDGSSGAFKSEDEELIGDFISTVDGSDVNEELFSSLPLNGTDILKGWEPILDELSNNTSSSASISIDIKDFEIVNYSIEYIDDIELENEEKECPEDELKDELTDEAEVKDEADTTTEVADTGKPLDEADDSENKKDEIVAKENEILPENIVVNKADDSDSTADDESDTSDDTVCEATDESESSSDIQE